MLLNAAVRSSVLTISDPATAKKEIFKLHHEDNLDEKVHGIYGMIKYNKSKYLIVVTEATDAGSIGGHAVHEIRGVRILAMGPEKNSVLIGMLNDFFKMPGMYFSEYDLFRRARGPGENLEFLFNRHLLEIYWAKHKHFALNCIQGYFGAWHDMILISRRSNCRAGVRYFSRGCSAQGDCSNFVETEQIIEGQSSYLQIRGSIPFQWAHDVDWRYRPRIVFADDARFERADARLAQAMSSISMRRVDTEVASVDYSSFERADAALKKKYSMEIVYLNLIRVNGYESEMCKRIKSALEGQQCIHYDFYNSMDKGSFPFDALNIAYSTDTESQRMLVRTNCMDCLDRTNSMQCMIGLRVLAEQLAANGVWKRRGKEYEKMFRRMFYENGNRLSIQYSGTPALLSEHILGRHYGAWASMLDGYYSIKRYLVNRLTHGRMQISYEIVTGCRDGGRLVDESRRLMAALYGFMLYITVMYGWGSSLPRMLLALALFLVFARGFFMSIIDMPSKLN